jgi:predicted nucleic acid-binding Zn ribbon protein
VRPIAGAIDRALRKLGLEREIARVSALDAWPDAARDVFGAAADATRAVGLSDRALIVAVPDAAWSSEIRLREGELVAAIARRATSDIGHIRTVPASGGGWHGSGDARSREPHS